MPWRLTALLAAGYLVTTSPAQAQFGPCAGLADPRQRLECYDRQAPAAPSAQAATPRAPAAAAPQGGCTPTSPCVGPRGGRYYFTASGAKRYLSR